MDGYLPAPNRLAAIVYDDGRQADALMSAFARELRMAGIAVDGLVQLPGEQRRNDAAMRVLDLASGEIIDICQNLGSGSVSCRLNAGSLALVAERLRQAALRPSTLLFVSKFGKQEALGRGLRAEIGLAVAEGRTILTAVKRPLVAEWRKFTGDMGTLLDSRDWVVRDWWRDVAGRA